MCFLIFAFSMWKASLHLVVVVFGVAKTCYYSYLATDCDVYPLKPFYYIATFQQAGQGRRRMAIFLKVGKKWHENFPHFVVVLSRRCCKGEIRSESCNCPNFSALVFHENSTFHFHRRKRCKNMSVFTFWVACSAF